MLATSASSSFAQAGLSVFNPYEVFHLCSLRTAKPDITINNCTLLVRGYKEFDAIKTAGYFLIGTAYVRKAQNDLASRNFNLAVAVVDKVLEKKPDTGWALNQRCWIRSIQGLNLDSAISDCDKALIVEPDNAAYRDSRAFALYRKGLFKEAVDEYNVALKEKVTASSLFMRGVAKIRMGLLVEAEVDIRAARENDPDIDTLYAGYGIKLG